jgi:hypothetical protein
MNDDDTTTPASHDDEGSLPVADGTSAAQADTETPALPPTEASPDDTQALPHPDDTQALSQPDETQVLPQHDGTRPIAETRPLPAAGPDDPLSVFDRPDEAAEPPRASGDAPSSVPGSPAEGPAMSQPAMSQPGSPGAPVPAAVAPQEPVSTGPRASTIVWGFLVVAFGVGLVATGAGARLDVGLISIVLLAAAGVLLVIGSVVAAVRRRRRSTTTG